MLDRCQISTVPCQAEAQVVTHFAQTHTKTLVHALNLQNMYKVALRLIYTTLCSFSYTPQ